MPGIGAGVEIAISSIVLLQGGALLLLAGSAMLAVRLAAHAGRRPAWLLAVALLILLVHQATICKRLLGVSPRPGELADAVVMLVATLLMLIAAVAITRVMVARQRADTALRDALEASADGVCDSDPQGRITAASPALGTLLGCTPDVLLGRDMLTLIAEADRDSVATILARLRTGGRAESFECWLASTPGTDLPVEIHAFPRQHAGVVTGLHYVLRSISVRKSLEELLQTHHVELKMLLDAVPSIIAYKNRDGVILLHNKAFADAREATLTRFVGKTTADVFPPEEAQKRMLDDQEVIASGEPKVNIIESYATSEGVRWARTSKLPIRDDRGQVTGLLALAEDITDLKAAEQELARVNRALKLASLCTKLLVHATEELPLLQQLCLMIVRVGAFHHATLGLVDPQPPPCFREVAHAGGVTGYPARIDLADQADGDSPQLAAIRDAYRTHEATVAHFADAPCGGTTTHPACTAVAVFPILTRGEGIIGLLVIGANRTDAFAPDEFALLQDLVSDITFGISSLRVKAERDQASQALLVSETRFRRLVNANLIGVVISDTNGIVFEANDTFLAMLGYTRQDLTTGHLRWSQLTPREYRPLDEYALQELTEQGAFGPLEKEYRCKDGHRLPVLVGGVLLESSNPPTMLTISIDISDRIKAEEALRQRESRLRSLLRLNEMADVTEEAITDFALEQAVQLTGSARGQLAFVGEGGALLSPRVWPRAPATDTAPTRLLDAAMCQRMPVVTNDGVEAAAAGPEICCLMSVPVFDAERLVAVVGVANKAEAYTDGDVVQLQLLMDGLWRILQRTRAEEALRRLNDELERRVQRRTAQLERSNADLQQFAYVASHDLQEPLRKIIAFGDRLEMVTAGILDERALDYLGRMRNAAARMRTLVEDLLALSRITSRGEAFTPVTLATVLAGVLDDLEQAITDSGAHLEIGDLPQVFADERQMRQLFQNLIGNALKFMPPDVSPVIRITGRPRGPATTEIAITDNGIGFEERYLDRIFLPFQRLHSRAEYSGSGIGLAICKKIVERHGGTITARSRPGEGTTFLVTLPAIGGLHGGDHRVTAESEADLDTVG